MFSLLRENIRIALSSIRNQSLRTVLTVLIIAIGITALVGILSAVAALENTISQDFASMGANTFNLQRYEFRERISNEDRKVNPTISYREVTEFKENFQFPFTETAISFTGTGSAEIKYQNEKTDPDISVLGVNEYYLENSGLEVEEGREFNIFDINNNNNVAVIGADYKDGIFNGMDPVNKTISIRGAKFRVIGILESKCGISNKWTYFPERKVLVLE